MFKSKEQDKAEKYRKMLFKDNGGIPTQYATKQSKDKVIVESYMSESATHLTEMIKNIQRKMATMLEQQGAKSMVAQTTSKKLNIAKIEETPVNVPRDSSS